VQTLAAAKPHTASTRGRPLNKVLAPLVLFALWFGLCKELSGEWSVNEQYNFGWFVPFFALYLFWLRWQDRLAPAQISNSKPRISSPAALALAIAALLLLLPVRLFEIANPEWRLLAWTHAVAVVTLTFLFIWYAGGGSWLRHFAFPVIFIFVAVPWPTAVEVPVIQGLMRMVAHVAAETAMLLGIPAQVEGNLIRVSNGLVGVNEACSGIRSLQTSLMIGLLFGELKRLSVSRRLALVAGAVAIALLANFLRAVFLVQVAATKSISEVGHWHDIAGYTIIALVFIGTVTLAYLLGPKKTAARSGVSPATMRLPSERLPPQLSTGLLSAALCWLLLIEIGTAAWYRAHETNLVRAPRWNVRWPKQARNFHRLNIDEEIRAVLRFDEGDAAAWTLNSAMNPETSNEPNTIACSLYVFRWKPGKNSAPLANLHRPDVCLPASGWKQIADHGVRSYPIGGSVELPFRHFEFQRAFENSAPQTAHAFYCLSEDRASGAFASFVATNAPGMFGNRSDWTRAERVRAVLQGRRHLGQHVIEAIFISNEPFSTADAESRLADLARNVVSIKGSDD
jgi:exosortase